MKMNLDQLEIRVLGCLIEKELSTPENYPLSLNALLAACNQKSNRDPAMALSEQELLQALGVLGSRGLARLTTTGGRVARYCHNVAEKLGLSPAARALLAELMLRGPQTPGELRTRAERMAAFADPAAVELALGELLQCGPPLVMRLPRQPGRKEPRYAQLLAGVPEIPESDLSDRSDSCDVAPPAQERRPKAPAASERLVRVESDVAVLREEIAVLRQEIEELVSAFG
uniref:YceH family protein n=1 Tax=Geomonas sp. TaxID=2651584 RepID=UPI002B47ABEE|nr:DUF480 domain-containing protein [Geomonas sp.]HJV33549.1 DUF480 domain-containing protein [Geomonas sp.]